MQQSKSLAGKFRSNAGATRAALVAILLAAVIAVGVPSAQPVCVPITQSQITQSWSGSFPLALIAVLISFIIATIIFMVGAAAKNDRIRNFGIGEFYEAVATALIVGFFLFSAGLLLNTVPSALIGSTQSLPTVNSLALPAATTDPYVFADNGICNTVNSIELLYNYNFLQSTPAGAPSWPTPWLPSIFTPAPGYAGLAEALSVTYTVNVENVQAVTNLLGNGVAAAKLYANINYIIPMATLSTVLADMLYLLWGEYYLMAFFSFMAPALLAAGVVFRAFLPTRGFGGMMIAIGMGFYVIMPVLFAFIFTQCIPGTVGCPIQAQATPFSPILPNAPTNLSQYWLFVLLYPILAISMTYVFITQLSNFLGASASMGSRLRAGFI